MGHSIKIGNIEFSSKKEALIHFKRILNSYKIGEELIGTDLDDILNLLKTNSYGQERINESIKAVKVSKLKKFNARGFELETTNGTRKFFSYTKRINSPKNNFTKFSEACRQTIQSDLIKVKQDYFKRYAKDGQVKCQESKELAKYEELNIDHRQPNTFSIIVERFIELNNLNLEKIEYVQVEGAPNELADINLKRVFQEFHKLKANLRIVKKDLNLGRSYQARSNRQKKDLTIE